MPANNKNASNHGPSEAYRSLAAAQLQSVSGFDCCDLAVIRDWVHDGELFHAPRGTVVYRRGARGEGLLLVVDGAAVVGRHLGQPKAHIFSYLGAGDVHGFLSLLDDGPQIHDLMAHEDSVLLRVPDERVRADLARQPALRDAFVRHLAHRSRIAYDRLYDQARQPLSARLARLLDHLARSFGAPREDGVLIRIRITQSDLAHALGASRQQVNAELKQFEARGLVALSRSRLVLRDVRSLAAGDYSASPLMLAPGFQWAPSSRGRRRGTPRASRELTGLKVLLVEDDAVTRLVVATQLQQSGATVVEADDGVTAVEQVQRHRGGFDAIVMDELMPQLTGSQAARRIRRHEAEHGLARTPILGVSTNQGRQDVRRYLAAGMDVHLAKPFRRDELVAALRGLVARR